MADVAVLAAAEVAHPATRFRDEEVARRRVPRREADLPESVEPAGCNIGEVERSRSGPAHARGRTHDALEHAEVGPEPAAVLAEWKARADERAIESETLRHAQPPPVQQRAGAALGREQLPPQRVEHDADFRATAVAAGDRDCKLREAVQEVRRAVERVDDPGVVVARGSAAFLREEAVRRVGLADGGNQHLLRGAVDLAHEVVAVLLADRERPDAVEAAHDDVAGAARGADCDVEQRMHDLEYQHQRILTEPRCSPLSASYSSTPATPATSARARAR